MSILYDENKNGRALTRYRDLIEFTPHFHENTELVTVEKGCCTARVDFEDHTLSSKDLFISPPNRIHSYSDEKDIKCYLFNLPAQETVL